MLIGFINREELGFLPLFRKRDFGAGFDLEGRDIYFHTIDGDMTMRYHLAGLVSGAGPADFVDDVIQACFQEFEEFVSCDARAVGGFFEIVLELLFVEAIDSFKLLFLAQLKSKVRRANPTGMRTRRIIAPIKRTLGGQASISLQEKFFAFAPA